MHVSIISFLFLFPSSEFMDLLHYMGWGCKSIVTDGIPGMHQNTNTGSKSPTTWEKYRLARFQTEWIGVTR